MRQRWIGEARAEIAAHGRQFSESARHHDDAAAVRDEREERISDVSRPEEVRCDRPGGGASIGAPGANSRIVHEQIETGHQRREGLCNGGDARPVGDVQLMIQHVAAVGIQSSNRRGSLLLVAACQDHTESFGPELDGRLEPQAPIRAGDEGRRTIRRGSHSSSQDRRSLFSLCARNPPIGRGGDVYFPQERRRVSASPASSRTISPAFWTPFTPSTDSPAHSGIASNVPVVVLSATNESRACTGTRTSGAHGCAVSPTNSPWNRSTASTQDRKTRWGAFGQFAENASVRIVSFASAAISLSTYAG